MKPLDQLEFNNSDSSLPEYFYTRIDTTPLDAPKFVCFSREAGKLLNLDDSTTNMKKLTRICSGNAAWPGSTPLAMVYSDHQFGDYTNRAF